MAVLVTGATGYLGVSLVRRLLARGDAKLRLLVREGSDTRALDAACVGAAPGTVERVVGSLDSVQAASRLLAGMDTVCHLAATMRGSAAEVLHGTVASSRNLLDAALLEDRPPRILLVGSLGVYGTALLEAGSLVDESTPLEQVPSRRDVYSHAKLEQERVFRDYHLRHGLPLTVLRPGVIHGPGKHTPSNRVGMGPYARVFFLLGGDNPLPLTHVENCAEAICFVASHAAFAGEAHDVVDEDIPTCRAYLARYRQAHPSLIVIPICFPLLRMASSLVAWLHRRTGGRFPLVLTPYRTRSTWKPLCFSGAAIRSLGFEPPLTGTSALDLLFPAVAQGPGHAVQADTGSEAEAEAEAEAGKPYPGRGTR